MMLSFLVGVVRADSRTLLRDPVLPLFALVPFLAAGAVFFALPPLLGALSSILPGDILHSYSEIRTTVHLFLLLTAPLMWGTVYGFFALDDRDDGIFQILAASPVSPGMLLSLRLLLPAFCTLLYIALLRLLLPLPNAPGALWMGASLLMALEAPLTALIVATLASNKVEGLAVSKASSLLFVGPLIGLLLPEPRSFLGMIAPQYWVVVPLVRGVEPLRLPLILAVGLLYHLALILLLARRYTR